MKKRRRKMSEKLQVMAMRSNPNRKDLTDARVDAIAAATIGIIEVSLTAIVILVIGITIGMLIA